MKKVKINNVSIEKDIDGVYLTILRSECIPTDVLWLTEKELADLEACLHKLKGYITVTDSTVVHYDAKLKRNNV